jgi:hypothetical protein
MPREKFILGQDCLIKHTIAWTGWAIINDVLHFLICLLPPASIWFQTQEIFEAENLKIFDSFGRKTEPKKFLDKSWERAFLVCIILTLFGWFPGVLFATFMAYKHMIAYMIQKGMWCSCFVDCFSVFCCVPVEPEAE